MNFRTGGFDWDEGNKAKCRKHGLTLEDIEGTFKGNPLVLPDRTQQSERRFNAVGPNPEGRHVFIVYTLRERDGSQLIRPISARYMHSKEVEAYEHSRKA